jgi:hypothetical protein
VSSFQQSVGQCGEVTYPSTVWEEKLCSGPDLSLLAGGKGLYDDNGTQGSSYKIGEATGEAASMTGFSSESDSGAGANYYSIQTNSNHFRNSSWYDGKTMLANQSYWEQFTFVNEALSGGNGYGEVAITYWLINYLSNHSSCPALSVSWTSLTHYLSDGAYSCGAPTYYTQTPQENPSGLASYSLSGCVSLCDQSGKDSAIFCYSSTCDYQNDPDSVLGLGSHWAGVEWNILGKTNSTANFSGTGSSGTDISAKVYLWDSSDNTHSVSSSETDSTTLEKNNLSLYSWDSGHTGYYDFTECQTTPC